MNGLGLEPHWMWMLAAILLGIAELIVPGVFLIWLAAAAAATGLIALAFGIALPFQFAAFALLAIAAVFFGRRWYDNNPMPSADPLLNDRAARLTGRTVVVAQAIVNGEGRVRVGDSVWSCRGPDCAEGSRVRIAGADGSCLKVEPVGEIEGPGPS
ncbi:MAG TPA: NfeD family protein [Allosphingosinicella sp.]|nr:NfeD family protein [Allosphingosinicella sp.]